MEPKIEATLTSCKFRIIDGANYYFTTKKVPNSSGQGQNYTVTIEVETPAGRRIQATVPLKDNQYVEIPAVQGDAPTPYVSGLLSLRDENGYKAVFLGATLWVGDRDAPKAQINGLIAVI